MFRRGGRRGESRENGLNSKVDGAGCDGDGDRSGSVGERGSRRFVGSLDQVV